MNLISFIGNVGNVASIMIGVCAQFPIGQQAMMGLNLRNNMPRSEEQPDFVGYCLCNCPIYAGDPKPIYTCNEYPCYPQDGDLEEGDDEIRILS